MLIWWLWLASGIIAADPIEDFKARAVPLVRKFIFSNYEKFAESELTFRHLKTHLQETMGIPYETLSKNEYAEIIEDVTDEIANECNMGEVPMSDCKQRIAYVEDETTPALKDET